MEPFCYNATVNRVIDGDTVELTIDLGFDVFKKVKCRVYGINCPEKRSKSTAERVAGMAATTFAVCLMPDGSPVKCRTVKAGNEKFGRYLAEIVLPDGRLFANEMISAGHATEYFGGSREPNDAA